MQRLELVVTVFIHPYLSWGSTTHVVSVTRGSEKLIVELNQTSEDEHLGLAPSWHSIPSLKSLGWEGAEVDTVRQISWETESRTNNPPADESSHCNTTVLHFRMTEPRDGLIGTKLCKSKRIPDLSKFNSVWGSEDVIAASGDSRGLRRKLRTGEGGGGAEGKEERGKLHGAIVVLRSAGHLATLSQ